MLLAHDWPGNVRELRNVIERAMVLEEAEWIQVSNLQIASDAKLRRGRTLTSRQSPEGPFEVSLEEAEKEPGEESARKSRGQSDPRRRAPGRHARHPALQNEEVQPPLKKSSINVT